MKRKILLFLCLLVFKFVSAQDVPVTGKVIDAGGEELIGVSVTLKGSSVATQTNVEGNYTITVPSNGVLVFTYLGFNLQEVPVNNQTTVNITLTAAAQSLNEVVVVGYGTQRKRDLTGAITQIKGEEIEKLPNINPVSSLQGKVAGLTVVNSGSPGAAPVVRIRGINSTAGANPLFVVDGIFQDNIDYINSADIESIEVLKDPSSIAIFGLRGGNGVIVVTTKRAAKGQTLITYQGSVGVQKVINTIDVVDAEGFKKLYNAQLNNLNVPAFDYTNYTANTDWQDLILRTAVMTNNNISIANSGEKSTTLINLGHNKQEGVVKYGDFERFVARFNQEVRVSKNLKVGGDITGSHIRTNGSAVNLNTAIRSVPIVPVQFDENTYYSMPSFQRAQVGNPIASLNQGNRNDINRSYKIVGSIFGEVKFLKQFKLRSSFYTDLSFNSSRGYTPLPNRFINLGEGSVATDTTINPNGRTSVRQNQDNFSRFQQDHTVSYDSVFNKVHRINAVVGFTTQYISSTTLSGSRTQPTYARPQVIEGLAAASSCYSSNCLYMYGYIGDKTISVWDGRTGLCVQTLYGHSNSVNHLAVTNRGDMVVSADADGMWALVDGMSGPEDRALYREPAFASAYRQALREGFAQGASGYARDLTLAMGRWPVPPEAITVPVRLWYGGRDASPVHSPDGGALLATRFPRAVRHFLPDEGGSLLWTRARDILRDLLAAAA
ncbi:MAG: SusC/RagA family TonB-linked outer membrane protein [Cytophagaceae bacterium]|nr:MAG: SusC/RagA family TonB-linked outer membrane protein [Cytophagaceae bacterium]